MMTTFLRTFAAGTNGSVMVEFAFGAPLILMLSLNFQDVIGSFIKARSDSLTTTSLTFEFRAEVIR